MYHKLGIFVQIVNNHLISLVDRDKQVTCPAGDPSLPLSVQFMSRTADVSCFENLDDVYPIYNDNIPYLNCAGNLLFIYLFTCLFTYLFINTDVREVYKWLSVFGNI